jgi:hypothetical protein
MTFRYCIVPFTKRAGVPEAVRAVREFLSPAWTVAGAGEERSFCSLDGDPAVTLSAIRARSGNRIVLRLVNPGREVARTTVRFARPVRSSRPLDLREGDAALGNTGLEVVRTAAPLELHDGAAAATLEAFEIGTWEIDFG